MSEIENASLEARNQALRDAAEVARKWGSEQVAKWSDHQDMCDDAKSRAWDANCIANAILAMQEPASEPAAGAPDLIYDPNDWEYPSAWKDRSDLVDSFDGDGDVYEFATLVKGPAIFAAYVILNEDEDGEWQWFKSKLEAEEAVIGGREKLGTASPPRTLEAK